MMCFKDVFSGLAGKGGRPEHVNLFTVKVFYRVVKNIHCAKGLKNPYVGQTQHFRH